METLKIGNYKNVFKAYENYLKRLNASLKTELENVNNSITALEREKAVIEAWFKNKPVISSTQMRKLVDAEEKNSAAIEAYEKAKAEHPILSEDERAAAEERYAEAKKVYDETQDILKKLIKDKAPDSNIRNVKDILKVYEAAVKENKEIIEKDDKNIAIVKTAKKNLDKTTETLKAIRESISSTTEEAAAYATEYLEKRKQLATINKKLKELKTKKANIEETLSSKPNGTAEDFKNFLKEYDLPTTHAEELFNLFQDPKYSIELGIDDFDLRKQNPKRDYFLKKILTPILVSGALGGGIAGAAAASGAIAGSNLLWAVISTNPTITFLSAFIPGFAIGAAASVGFIALKNAITIAHYNIHYGNAKAAVKELKNEKTIETTKIYKLLQTIEATKEKILDLRSGSKFSKPFRWIARGFLNIVNRNRIHHIEAVTKGLIVQFEKIFNNKDLSDLTKYEELTPIFELLESIGTSIADDLYNSKIHALLTCKEKGAKHAHTIENADIYSNLATYLEIYNEFNESTRVTPSALKTISKDAGQVSLGKKKITAHTLLNNDPTNEETKVGSGLVYKRYIELKGLVKPVETPVEEPKHAKEIANFGAVDNTLIINYTDGSSSSHTVANATNITNVTLSSKTIVCTFKDGTQKKFSISTKIPKRITTISSEANMLACLQNDEFIEKLKALGFEESKILELRDCLARCQNRKIPSKFENSKAYKEGNFSQIYNACAILSAKQITVLGL